MVLPLVIEVSISERSFLFGGERTPVGLRNRATTIPPPLPGLAAFRGRNRWFAVAAAT